LTSRQATGWHTGSSSGASASQPKLSFGGSGGNADATEL
jgi:hypothetical protein